MNTAVAAARSEELARLVKQQQREMRADGATAPEQREGERWPRPDALWTGAPRHPRQEPEGAYVDPEERVDWTNEARDIRAQLAWQPSLVRKGERPHVEHALRLADLEDAEEQVAALDAAMKGKKGKQRQLMKRKRERLLRVLASWGTEREPLTFVEPSYPEPRVREPRRITQRDYWAPGWVGCTARD